MTATACFGKVFEVVFSEVVGFEKGNNTWCERKRAVCVETVKKKSLGFRMPTPKLYGARLFEK